MESQTASREVHSLPLEGSNGDEIDIRALLLTLKGYRRAIAVTTALITLIAALYAFLSPNTYTANVLISSVDRSASGGARAAAALSGQLGGLASLAGLSVGHDSGKDVAVATLSSRMLIEAMIRDDNLLPVLFKRRWDAERQAWKSADPKKIPTLLDGYEMFTKRIAKISEDKKTSLVAVTVSWTSPELAANWANELVKRTNDLLRKHALDESEHNLQYLQEEALNTSVVEMRHSIFSLMESELQKTMIAKGDEEYAFKVVDPAVVPERKSAPKRVLIVLEGFVGGLVVGVIGALLHHSLQSSRPGKVSFG